MLKAPVGLLGGTFDPIHIGHLRPAIEARDALGLAEMRLIPNHIPPHRANPFCSSE
ncbi:MAG: nicotinate-nicotinamide nucleotide adenylyltransferase, partial [Aeromonas veronii]